MRDLQIAFISLVVLYVSCKAETIGQTTKRQDCYMEVYDEWHSFCDGYKIPFESCSYKPRAGWALRIFEPTTEVNNYGAYINFTIDNSNDNNLVSEDLSVSVFQALLASGKLDNDGLLSVETLMGEYVDLRKTAPANGTFSFEIIAHAKVRGECENKQGGYFRAYVEVEEVYLGKNYQDVIHWILLKNEELGPTLDKIQCDDTSCKVN